MTLFPEFEAQAKAGDFQAFWRLPIGAASPMWAAYGVMASAGVAYWWMSQWAKPVNLEAFAAKLQLPALPEAAVPPVLAEAPAVLAEAPALVTETPALIVDPPALLAETPSLVADTLAAIQPEPVAPPVDPVIEPEAPEAQLVQASADVANAGAELAGEAAMAIGMAADDLTKLLGIGPTLAGKLGNLGVRTFGDIASWTDEDLAKMDKALDLKGRAVRDRWVDQARQFAAQ